MANYVATYEDFKETPFLIKQYLGKPQISWYEVESDEFIEYKLTTTKSRSKLSIEYVEGMRVTGGKVRDYHIITMWWRCKN